MRRFFGDDDGTRLAARDLQHQRGGAFDRPNLMDGIHAALEALAGIRGEAESSAAPGNRSGLEPGNFEKHVHRLRAGRGALATHHARKPDGTLGVGDHQHVSIEGDLAPIEQRAALTGRGETHADVARNLRAVVNMHRLAELEHHQICDVDDR